MNILIEKKNLEKLNINEYKGKCNQALDYLWESPWVRASITKSNRKNLSKVQELADKISGQSDIALVIAAGALGKMIKGVLDALPVKEGGCEVIVFGDTFSPDEYAETLERLRENDFSIIAATEAEENLQMRAAYTCFKQNLVSRYGQEAAVERIYAVAGVKSLTISQDASENEYPVIMYPEEIPAVYGAATDAVLLPLAVKGYDAVEYLEGFYEMLASPAWDLDGADYSIARAAAVKEAGAREEIMIWQKQLADFALWQKSVPGMGKKTVYRMPFDADPAETADAETFETHFIVEKDETDIMMPYFEGCSMEGSLNALMKETADKYFKEENEGKYGVQISVERMDAYNLGQLTAFVQLSNGISEFLLNN